MENFALIDQFMSCDPISSLNIILLCHAVLLYPWANSIYYRKPISLTYRDFGSPESSLEPQTVTATSTCQKGLASPCLLSLL